MDYYIVRIYRHEKKKPHNFVGIVEAVDPKRDSKGKKAFTNLDELWDILNATGQLPERKKQDKGNAATRRRGEGATRQHGEREQA